MNNLFIILAMVFCHIVDDYYLQSCLASMKQKKWWQKMLHKSYINTIT